MGEPTFNSPQVETPESKEPSQEELFVDGFSQDLRDRMNDPTYVPDYLLLNALLQRAKTTNGMAWRKWREFFERPGHPVYEIFTSEYIRRFATYLADRVRDFGGTKEHPVIILECAAGDGRLTHFLQERLDMLCPGVIRVVATDPYAGHATAFSVDEIGNSEALAKYHPQIVIVSWMPYREDFTADFREDPGVKEYILIGEGPGGACGRDWETWGWPRSDTEKHVGETPPYEADGFTCSEDGELSEFQLSRSRSPARPYADLSTTYRFVRKLK